MAPALSTVFGAVCFSWASAESLNSYTSAEVSAELEAWATKVMDPDSQGHAIGEGMDKITGKMTLQSAFKVVEDHGHGLPVEVSNLVQTFSEGSSASAFDEASLAKARRALNGLIEKAWIELDDEIFKCKGFQEMNRENYGQVTRDIERLIFTINDLERVEAESIDNIQAKEKDIRNVEEQMHKEYMEYLTQYYKDSSELTIRQNDLDVFTFIIDFTSPEKMPCAEAPGAAAIQLCETKGGRKTFLFEDSQTQKKYLKLLNSKTRNSVDNFLRTFMDQPGGTNSTTPPPPQDATPVMGDDGGVVINKNLKPAQMDCGENCIAGCTPEVKCHVGLLHDKLSLMWGEYKDQVDELTMEMMHNFMLWQEVDENLKDQKDILVAAKGQMIQLLAEARSHLAEDRSELTGKYKLKSKLDKQYYVACMKCKKRICWIMHQDICAVKVVRNAVMENSTDCPTVKIADCAMDDWVPDKCTKSCDDKCDPDKPFKCGGWQLMKRKVVVQPDECGLKCPVAEKYKRCGQFPCPVNCMMSTWSGWSACTAECGGGVRSKTRSVLIAPKNGGERCNTPEESQACKSGSCTRDCTLQHRWGSWSPCTVACGGGFQNRRKHVIIPIRGEGKCPKDDSAARFEEQECNTQDCNGDEVCIAKQDLVIALDGSGSIMSSGFDKIKAFANVLVKRYQGAYFGETTMRIGVIVFGNGKIMADGHTIAPAILAQTLTNDINSLCKEGGVIEGLKHKAGFTNMAQAFALAEDVFIKKSRRGVQHSMLLITDGKPSFKFMTNEMVQQLDDKAIMRYFVVVNDEPANSDVMKVLQHWASQPWETNMVHVPTLEILDADADLWAMKALTKFCPQAYSPMAAEYHEQLVGFIHVKDGGWCGGSFYTLKKNVLGKGVADAEQCAALATGAKASSFLLGAYFRRGWCIAGNMKVDQAQFDAWHKGRVAPTCDQPTWGGKTGWRKSMLYDFYAMAPVASTT